MPIGERQAAKAITPREKHSTDAADQRATPAAAANDFRHTPRATLDNARRSIAECSLFGVLDPKDRDVLVKRVRLRTCAAGETIFLMGDAGDSAMAVITGTVRISVPSPEGKEIALALMHAGDLFGELALLDGKERSADAAALTACSLAVLDRRDLLSFLEHHPSAWKGIVEMLCARLRRTTLQAAEVSLLSLPARLARALLRISGDAGNSGRADLEIRLSQRELGNVIGGTRESVNKCLRDWQRRGIVELDEALVKITNRSALQRMADSPER
jgi:CRP-like cAMP-binding protein